MIPRTCYLITAGLASAAALSAQDSAQVFRPFSIPAYRLVNSVAWTPQGDSMLVALYYRDVQKYRGQPSDTTMPVTALYLTQRDGDGWSEPTLLPWSGQYQDYEPALLPNGAVLIFNSRRPWPDGRLPPHNDLWMVRRTSAGWDVPQPLSEVNTFDLEESYATLTTDGRMIFLKGLGNEVYDLYESRLRPDGTFSTAVRS